MDYSLEQSMVGVSFAHYEILSPMLAAKRSAGVAPEVNLRERVTRTPPPSVNKAEPRGDVENRGISGTTKRTHVLQKFFKKCCHPDPSDWQIHV